LLATLNELACARCLAWHRPARIHAQPATLLRLSGKGGSRPARDADLVALDARGGSQRRMDRRRAHVRAGAVQRRGIFEG
jgi:hypothetical protein